MARESGPRRHHSRFEREPSPKRSRGSGKPTMERSPHKLGTEVRGKNDDRKHRHRLQDPLPSEKLPASDPKHGDRSNAVQDGSRTRPRGTSERGWWRDQKDERRGKDQTSFDALGKSDRSVAHEKDNSRAKNHDQPSRLNADHSTSTRKRFREEKPGPAEPQTDGKNAPDAMKPALVDGSAVGGGGRREERGSHRQPDRTERDRTYTNRGRPERVGGFPSRDRYNGGRFGGREGGFSSRQGYQAGGGRVEKWKHDLYDEVNRSPPKNEEDPVAKVEALLS